MYVISPWSRGGWVNSQVFDHTSVIRFLEARFGVMEPNISPWRRAVCGDLTSAFNFRTPNAPFPPTLPSTVAAAARAAALPGRATPATPAAPGVPVQAAGSRPSRALPYALAVEEDRQAGALSLTFLNDGQAGAVFHVYDRLRLERPPRRYTIGAGDALQGVWDPGIYDLWILGPNGFHRHFVGDAGRAEPGLAVTCRADGSELVLTVDNSGAAEHRIEAVANAGPVTMTPWRTRVAPGTRLNRRWPVADSHGWYDLSIRCTGMDDYLRRLAGRLETGADSMSDPAMGGPAIMDQSRVV
jgi:phospholipase C